MGRIYLARSIVAALISLLTACIPHTASASAVEWIRREATSSPDQSTGVAADRLGNVYVVGSRADDGFLSKYDASGNLKWMHVFDTSGGVVATDVVVDDLGSVYVAGQTGGVLGAHKVAAGDSFVSRFDVNGALVWTSQFGTDVSPLSSQSTTGISADGMGNLYVTGSTPTNASSFNNDVYVTKMDVAGNLLWTRKFGTSLRDSAEAIAADKLGNIYVTGFTFGGLGGPHMGSEIIPDAFVSRLDTNGNVAWSRQIGAEAHDYGTGAVIDQLGNVYVTGATNSELDGPYSGGFHDAFVTKYDVDGNLVWIRQDGSVFEDEAYGIAADGNGGIYISGNISDPSEASPLWQGSTFITKYDLDGNFQWTGQISGGSGLAISVDPQGTIFVAGQSVKLAVPPSMDWGDAFVAKLGNLPEPDCMGILLCGLIVGLAFQRGKFSYFRNLNC